MKYNIGNRVRIKSRQWYLSNRDCCGYIKCAGFDFSPSKARYCGYIFEIARIFKGAKNANVYALNYVDGYFTEDMFDAVPNDAPLTITNENFWGATGAIEKDSNWFKEFPLPPKDNNSTMPTLYEWYKAIDDIAEDVALGYYKGIYKNAEPIGLLRPYAIDDTCIEGIGYKQIPDYGFFHTANGKWLAAIYIVVWRFNDGKEYYSIVSIHNPQSNIYHPKPSVIHEHNEGAIKSSYREIMIEAAYYVRRWFISDQYTVDGTKIISCGQKVRVKSRQWYDSIKNEYNMINMPYSKGEFSPFMAENCGKILTIGEQRSRDLYTVSENRFIWPRWCFDLLNEADIIDHSIAKSKATPFNNSSKTYLMHDGNTGHIKIGKSINPKKRLRGLMCANPAITLRYICELDVEDNLHTKYAEKRVDREWFDLSQEDIDYICRNYNFYEYKDE